LIIEINCFKYGMQMIEGSPEETEDDPRKKYQESSDSFSG